MPLMISTIRDLVSTTVLHQHHVCMVLICASVTMPAGETMFCTFSKVPRRVYPRAYGGTATEDRIMRSVAQSEGISHHDVLWGHRPHA